MDLMNLVENMVYRYNLALNSYGKSGTVEYGVNSSQPVREVAKYKDLTGEGIEDIMDIEVKFDFLGGSMESQPFSLSREGSTAYVALGDSEWEVDGDFALPGKLFPCLTAGEGLVTDYLMEVGKREGSLYVVDLSKVEEPSKKLVTSFIGDNPTREYI